MKTYAVIGAGYGDEGKGVLTDYLSEPQSLVVRFNGGAQAGHTVVTPQGQRHVFKHLGAGSFKGASTLLSRFFVVNPILFNQERKAFPNVNVFVDPRAIVTTPFDMVLNQESEKIRRHGSVGIGINETVTRCERGVTLTASMLRREKILRAVLAEIREEYYPRRAMELGVDISRINTEAFIEKFVQEVSHCSWEIIPDVELIRQYNHVVFEGAQGLRLDEFSPDFPHVTRSRTGSPNVVTLCTEAGISEIDVHYVSRGYRTRHGNGPLREEVKGHPFGWAGPETNQSHEFQGEFRYAKLDPAVLIQDISRDLVNWVGTGILTGSRLALTCLDQMPLSEAILMMAGINLTFRYSRVKVSYISFGPTRDAVRKRNDGHWIPNQASHRSTDTSVAQDLKTLGSS